MVMTAKAVTASNSLQTLALEVPESSAPMRTLVLFLAKTVVPSVEPSAETTVPVLAQLVLKVHLSVLLLHHVQPVLTVVLPLVALREETVAVTALLPEATQETTVKFRRLHLTYSTTPIQSITLASLI